MTTQTTTYALPASVLAKVKEVLLDRKFAAQNGATEYTYVEAYQLVYDTVKNDL